VLTVPLDDAGSFTWLVHEDEFMERASTALALRDGWLLVDALDHPELDELLARGGGVIGVVSLLDRHRRDAESIAARHGAALRLAAGSGGEGFSDLTDEVREFALMRRPWREAAIWQPERERLLVGEALGTATYYRGRPGERLSVHPFARPLPPRRALGGLPPRQICVGHGRPLLDGAAPALEEALLTARRRLPQAWLRLARLAAAARRGA
jgi:hypothetical protein